MLTEAERLAVLENRMESVEKGQEHLQERHDQVMMKLESLLTAMTRYKGFVGGIMFTLTALGGVLGFLINYWFQKPN